MTHQGGSYASADDATSESPETGIYRLRKRVPAHLQEVVGKVAEKLSLTTREHGEAKKRLAVALAALE